MEKYFSTHFTVRHFALVPNINMPPLFMEAKKRFGGFPIRIERFQGLVFLTEAANTDEAINILKRDHPELFESSTYDTLPVASPEKWRLFSDSSVMYLPTFHELMLGNVNSPSQAVSSVVLEHHQPIMETLDRTHLLWQPNYTGTTPSLQL